MTAPEPADQTRADVVLTEAERESLPFGPAYYPAVERIIADRLAAERAEHAAEVEALRQQRDALVAGHQKAVRFGAQDRARAEAAEATVARVRALADDLCDFHGGHGDYLSAGKSLRAALDGERP